MRKHTFNLPTEDDLIIIEAFIGDHPVRLALDTAATHTTIDWNMLLVSGLTLDKQGEWLDLETSNGIMKAQLFTLPRFSALGDELFSFQVLTYDFLEKGILSTYDGMLELDFFRQRHVLTLDFIEQVLWLKE